MMTSRQVPVDLYENPFHSQQQQQEQEQRPKTPNRSGAMFNRGSRHHPRESSASPYYPSSGGGVYPQHSSREASSSHINNAYFSSYNISNDSNGNNNHKRISSSISSRSNRKHHQQRRSCRFISTAFRFLIACLLLITIFVVLTTYSTDHETINVVTNQSNNGNVFEASAINTTSSYSMNNVYGTDRTTSRYSMNSVYGTDRTTSTNSSSGGGSTGLFNANDSDNLPMRTLQQQQQQPVVANYFTTSTNLISTTKNDTTEDAVVRKDDYSALGKYSSPVTNMFSSTQQMSSSTNNIISSSNNIGFDIKTNLQVADGNSEKNDNGVISSSLSSTNVKFPTLSSSLSSNVQFPALSSSLSSNVQVPPLSKSSFDEAISSSLSSTLKVPSLSENNIAGGIPSSSSSISSDLPIPPLQQQQMPYGKQQYDPPQQQAQQQYSYNGQDYNKQPQQPVQNQYLSGKQEYSQGRQQWNPEQQQQQQQPSSPLLRERQPLQQQYLYDNNNQYDYDQQETPEIYDQQPQYQKRLPRQVTRTKRLYKQPQQDQYSDYDTSYGSRQQQQRLRTRQRPYQEDYSYDQQQYQYGRAEQKPLITQDYRQKQQRSYDAYERQPIQSDEYQEEYRDFSLREQSKQLPKQQRLSQMQPDSWVRQQPQQSEKLQQEPLYDPDIRYIKKGIRYIKKGSRNDLLATDNVIRSDNSDYYLNNKNIQDRQYQHQRDVLSSTGLAYDNLDRGIDTGIANIPDTKNLRRNNRFGSHYDHYGTTTTSKIVLDESLNSDISNNGNNLISSTLSSDQQLPMELIPSMSLQQPQQQTQTSLSSMQTNSITQLDPVESTYLSFRDTKINVPNEIVGITSQINDPIFDDKNDNIINGNIYMNQNSTSLNSVNTNNMITYGSDADDNTPISSTSSQYSDTVTSQGNNVPLSSTSSYLPDNLQELSSSVSNGSLSFSEVDENSDSGSSITRNSGTISNKIGVLEPTDLNVVSSTPVYPLSITLATADVITANDNSSINSIDTNSLSEEKNNVDPLRIEIQNDNNQFLRGSKDYGRVESEKENTGIIASSAETSPSRTNSFIKTLSRVVGNRLIRKDLKMIT